MDEKLTVLLDFFRRGHNADKGGLAWDKELCRRLLEASDATEASIWQAGRDECLYLKCGTNIAPEDIRGVSVGPGKGITRAAAFSNKTLTVNDTFSSRRHNKVVDRQINFRTFSMISAPMVFDGHLYGAINILNHRSSPGKFSRL